MVQGLVLSTYAHRIQGLWFSVINERAKVIGFRVWVTNVRTRKPPPHTENGNDIAQQKISMGRNRNDSITWQPFVFPPGASQSSKNRLVSCRSTFCRLCALHLAQSTHPCVAAAAPQVPGGAAQIATRGHPRPRSLLPPMRPSARARGQGVAMRCESAKVWCEGATAASSPPRGAVVAVVEHPQLRSTVYLDGWFRPASKICSWGDRDGLGMIRDKGGGGRRVKLGSFSCSRARVHLSDAAKMA